MSKYSTTTERWHSMTERIDESRNAASFINLADDRLGAQALSCTDEFFAPMARMLSAHEPEWRAGLYDAHGKWMDGWETRRRRDRGHDHCVIKLAGPCTLNRLEIDTRFFTGNFPPYASVDACCLPDAPDKHTAWSELLPYSPLQGNFRNTFAVKSSDVVTHLRLNIFPDGGVARFRAFGFVHRDWERCGVYREHRPRCRSARGSSVGV